MFYQKKGKNSQQIAVLKITDSLLQKLLLIKTKSFYSQEAYGAAALVGSSLACMISKMSLTLSHMFLRYPGSNARK